MRGIGILVAAVALIATGCCCHKKQPSKPEPELSEPVTLENRGGKFALLVAGDGPCTAVMSDVADGNWNRVVKETTPPMGCQAHGRTKAILLKRGDDCWKVHVDSGKCKGTWWTLRDWIVQ